MNYKEMTLKLIEQKYDSLLSLLKEFRSGNSKNTILWGTGAIAHILYQYLKKYGRTIDYFCDNNPEMVGQLITSDKVVCLSPEEVSEIKNADIIIASTNIDEIEIQIKNSGMQANIVSPPLDPLVFVSIILSDLECQSKQSVKDAVAQVFDLLSDEMSRETLYFKIWAWFSTPEDMKNYKFDNILTSKQYIPDGIISMNKDSIIVDCGAYVGDTLELFIDSDIQFKKYIAYELDKNNFDELKKFVDSSDNNVKQKVSIHNLGVGDSECTISFFSKQYSSLILEENECDDVSGAVGKIVDLDTHLNGFDVSYIKMDIEGSEMSALRGAEKLIKQKHPDLAICIYHKATDLWEIPLFLKSCYLNYNFYIRHHAACYFDTVCYAVGGGKDEMEE